MVEIESIEEEIFLWLKQIFSKQEKRLLKRLNELWRRGVKDSNDVLELFDLGAEVGIFQIEAEEHYVDLLSERGNKVFDDLGIMASFNISDFNVQQALKNLTFKFANLVNNTTQEQLRKELSEAIAEGENIYQIRKRVQKVFDGTVRSEAYRARMIARTETISIANGGSRLAYEQSKVVEKKEWLSSRDNRVRPSHVQADGQIKGLKEKFVVGGFPLDYPGDPNAPPQERINCRCALLPILISLRGG